MHQTQTQQPGPAAAGQSAARADGLLSGYAAPADFFCEMLREGAAEDPAISLLRQRLDGIAMDAMRARARRAERELLERGITFTVYSDATAIDRILPLDLIPRVITAQEWRTIETGVTQRVAAINAFVHDVYHEQRILADGVVPRERVVGNPASLVEESHGAAGLLEYPVYTKPASWLEHEVPDVLLSGHHARIERWRRDQALERTARRRPDLLTALDPATLDRHDLEVLAACGWGVTDGRWEQRPGG